MGQANEAIVAYNGALDRDAHYGLWRSKGWQRPILATGKPELAQAPLDVAFQDTPQNPKVLLLLMGVTADYAGNHPQAQADYLEGLKYMADDPALSLDLALSLALSENYSQAIATLAPLAQAAPTRHRANGRPLALIYGLKGDRASAERLARIDLEPSAVQHNLAYYETLRHLAPDARSKAVLSATSGLQPNRPS